MAKKKSARRSRKSGGFSERARQALGVVFILLALLLLISLVSHDSLDDLRVTGDADTHLAVFDIQFRNQAGLIGAYLSFLLMLLAGWLSFFLPVGLGVAALRLFAPERAKRWRFNVLLLFAISVLGTMLVNIHRLAAHTLEADPDAVGGYVGEKLTLLAIKLIGELGSYVLLGGSILLLLVLYTSITPVLAKALPLPGRETVRKIYTVMRNAAVTIFSFRWLVSQSEDEEDEAAAGESEPAAPAPSRERPPDSAEFEDLLDEQIEADAVPDGADPAADREPRPKKPRAKPAASPSDEPVTRGSIDYRFPPLSCLARDPNPANASVTEEELKATSRMLKETLETFGVSVSGEIEYYPGPVITRFELKPAAGVKVNQIVNLSDDLALALKAKRIRIIAPIPGKAAVGIEIPNRKAQLVYLRDILEDDIFARTTMRLPLALGKTTAGKPYAVDLAKLPHLLIAGATGSGKSVCANVLITSLIYKLHPHQIRFIMIDPKMLELTAYSGIPHLGRPVVTNPKRAEKVLSDAVVEMEQRYRRLAAASVRNIEDFNRKQEADDQRLPYIVILVDELADLLMSSTSSRMELLITRLAQMARAVGIHLVLATQRPSVDVITGLIKANFPARLAFQVSSKVDSRTIIDANGAEKLLGNGDMLFLYPGQPEPIRIHGAYLTGDETEAIVTFIKAQELPMLKLENISQATGEAADVEEVDAGDPLFREACEVVIRHKQGSVSLLQRRLGIGYQRAARLIDKLEKAGVVSPFDGSKAREVLVDKSYLETLAATEGAPVAEQETN